MNYKKDILKKYTGKGGIITDTIKEIPGTIKKGYKNVKDKVQSGITRGIVRMVGDTPAGNILKSGLAEQKKESMKQAIKQAMPKKPVTALDAMDRISRPTPMMPGPKGMKPTKLETKEFKRTPRPMGR